MADGPATASADNSKAAVTSSNTRFSPTPAKLTAHNHETRIRMPGTEGENERGGFCSGTTGAAMPTAHGQRVFSGILRQTSTPAVSVAVTS